MVETIETPTATPTVTTVVTPTVEHIKIALIELLNEGNPQLQAWINAALRPTVAESVITIAPIESPKPFQNGRAKERGPASELPFWKAHPEMKPLTPPKGSILTLEKLKKLQELFADAPPAEEIISYLTK